MFLYHVYLTKYANNFTNEHYVKQHNCYLETKYLMRCLSQSVEIG